jgi:hypothetical protein
MSSGRGLPGVRCSCCGDDPEDGAREVPLQAADDLSLRQPLCGSSSDVLACPGIPSQSDGHGSVERCVGLAMATAVEAATPSLAGRCLDGADPAKAANDASPVSRSGLSPAAISSVAAESGPIPLTSSSCGAVTSTAAAMRRCRSWISASRYWTRRARCRSVWTVAEVTWSWRPSSALVFSSAQRATSWPVRRGFRVSRRAGSALTNTALSWLIA